MNPIYVVAGENKIEVEQTIGSIISKSTEEYDLLSIDMEDSSLAGLLEEVNTIPFLTPTKIVVLKTPVVLYNKSKYDQKLVDAFINYLLHPVSTTTLIIVLKSLKDVDKDMLRVLKDNAIITEIGTITNENLDDYILNSFKNDGYSLDTNVIQELIDRTKGDANRVSIEIEKLKTFKYNEKTILNNDVRLLVSKDLDDNIFDLVNAVVAKDKQLSLKLYNDLSILNVNETTIISLLIAKFNELYQVKALTDGGYSKNDIADLFKVKPGRIYYLLKALTGVSIEGLKSNINYLTDLDYKIKSGLIDKTLGLELFFLK